MGSGEVLCRTEKGTLVAGECLTNERGEIVAAPPVEAMAAVVEAQLARLPSLVAGDRDDLEKKGIHVVTP